MKTLALTLVLITNAHAGYDDDFGRLSEDFPINRGPNVEADLDRLQRGYDRMPPVMPSMINPPKNEGSTYFGPDQWCRSDGSNTFCFRR